MKKLIARRPIQYMGRTYKCGETVPTENSQMVEAWLRANSAVWTDTDMEGFVSSVIQEAARRSKVNDMAAEAIRTMGVAIEDDAGEFVGVSSLTEQLRALFAPENLPDTSGEGETGQGSEAASQPAGRLDAEDLEKWKKADLEKLAEAMGVDISKARSNAERAAILAAAEVQVPADPPDDTGGGQ